MATLPRVPHALVRGWFESAAPGISPTSTASAALSARSSASALQSIAGSGFEVQFDPAKVSIFETASTVCVCVGTPRFERAALAQLGASASPAAACQALYAERGPTFAAGLRGAFAVVVVDRGRNAVVLAADRFSVNGLCYSVRNGRIAFSDRADCVPLEQTPEVDPQALFDYLYFHAVPAPRTVFRGVERLRAGHTCDVVDGRARVVRHWQPSFNEQDRRPIEELKREFRALIEEAVRGEAGGRRTGCFLSGGTDSSTVAGMLGRITGRPAPTFAIGFDAEGYDEMAYARIAARHFQTEHHEHYITREELADAIPKVAAWYDQPFGNSSAVPAFYCAKLGCDAGLDKMLAGDGGDELFGGNSRYALQRVYAAYSLIPAVLRRGLVEPMLLGLPFLKSIPLLRKAVSYVNQARLQMPDRLETYNLLLRLGVSEVLTPELLGATDPNGPRNAQRAVWDETNARTLVNQMLAYDWKYTLADNDLPKVCGTTALAGIAVGFPMLSDDLVDFSLRLEPALKLKGLKLRYFFKEALRGFLPEEIIAKRKHGFGLPFGVWLTGHAGLQALVRASFESLRARGIVRPEFLVELLDKRVREHAGYYGEMVWLLMILEQWLAVRVPGFAVR